MVAKKWYTRGKEGLEKTKKIQEENKKKSENKGSSRFFIKPGEEAKIVFLDSDPFFCYVHQFKHNGKWNNFATCVKDVSPCPLCDANMFPTWTAHYTIIDTREYEYNGKIYKNTKKIFPAKGNAIQILADLQAKYKNLAGCVFVVKRYGDKEVNTGEHFEYVGRIKNLSKITKDPTPVDYLKILAPPTKEQYEEWGYNVDNELGLESLEMETNDEALGDLEDVLDMELNKETLGGLNNAEVQPPEKAVKSPLKREKKKTKKDVDDDTLEDLLSDEDEGTDELLI